MKDDFVPTPVFFPLFQHGYHSHNDEVYYNPADNSLEEEHVFETEQLPDGFTKIR